MKTLETALDRLGKIISRNYGINVICRGNSCHTDGRTIVLPSLPDDLPRDLERAIQGLLDHEASHLLFSDFSIIPDFKAKYGEKGFGVLNICEDARVNAEMAKRFIGAGLNISEANQWVHRKITEAGVEVMSPWNKLSACICARALGLDSSIFGPDANAVVDTIASEMEEIKTLGSTKESAELAARIIEKLFQKTQEDNSNTNNETGEEGMSGFQEKTNEPTTNEDNTDANSSQPPAGQSEPKPQEEESEGANDAAAESSEDNSEADASTSGVSSTSFIKACMQDTAEAESMLEALIEREINELGATGKWRVYDPSLDSIKKIKAKEDAEVKSLLDEIRPFVSGLRQKLELILRGRKAAYWIGDQEDGTINHQKLSGLITGTATRIFKKKEVAETKSVAVSLLIDCSGSMRGGRIYTARQVALSICECLDSLNIPCEVIGFTTTADPDKYIKRAEDETGIQINQLMERYTRFAPLRIWIYKDFSDSFKAACGRFTKMSARGMTPLHESLMIAAKRLALRPETRKIIFCLTDGQPEVYPASNDIMMKEATETVRRLNKFGIEAIGVGIMTDAVQDIFPRHAVINSILDLPKSFYRELTKALAA